MSTELEKWLKKMEYKGEIPESLNRVCNSSTSYIWDQLAANAKPRQEVQNMRKNVMINRLKVKPLTNQDEFPYPIAEISAYNKKINLQKKVKHVQNIIDEKRAKADKMAQKNKINYVAVERLKAKIKQNQEREFLLTKRCTVLEDNIRESKEALGNVRNLTPVELEENSDVKKVTETLQKVSEKLTKSLQNIPAPTHQTSFNSRRMSVSAQKPPPSVKPFEKYFLLTDSKLKTSVRRRDTPVHRELKNVKKTLFSCEKENENANIVMKPTSARKLDSTFKNVETTKRESLGLLNQSFIENADLLNDFKYIGDDDTAFREMGNKNDDFFPGDKIDFEVEALPKFCGKSSESEAHQIEVLQQNKMLNDLLVDLLHGHNRQLIWNTVAGLDDNLQVNIWKQFSTASLLRKEKITKEDIARLHMIHIHISLNIQKQNRILKNLTSLINQRKDIIHATLLGRKLSKEQLEGKLTLFEQQLTDVALDGTLSAMKKEICSKPNFKENDHLSVVSKKLMQVKQEICTKIQNIHHYIKMAQNLFKTIKQTNDTTRACVRKLIPFTSDLSWCAILSQKVWTEENSAFDLFPLEYNRKFNKTIVGGPSHYRDICGNNFPLDLELDDEHLFMLAEVLESPFSPPEAIILNILKAKMKLNIMKTMRIDVKVPSYKKYSFEDLQKQESYIQFAMDRLNSLLYSSSSQKTLSCAEVAKKVMQIWLEMPFKDYVSLARLVEGKDYKYYEKRYDNYYDNI